jgi:hypothetical protein
MNKIFLAITLCFISINSYGADISLGRVVDIQGSGFISREGKTKEIKKGDQLFENSEIVIEHSGQVTFTDNADHRYHLGNSSSAAIGVNFIELRSGDIWFQSLNKTENYKVKTANAIVDYQGGEAVLSYDITKGKTQLMVINGMMKFSNLRTNELNLSVAEGNFSFIDNHYEEGAPRDPTPVGEKTYKQLVSMFRGVQPMDQKSEMIFKQVQPKREIASVHNEAHGPAKEEMKQEAKKVTKSPDLDTYREKVLTPPKTSKTVVSKKTKPTKIKNELMVVQIFGLKKPAVKESARMPASIKEAPVKAPAMTPEENNNKIETDNLLKALKNL